MAYLKKAGWILLAGLIALLVFLVLLLGLSATVEYFKDQKMLEPWLFADSFLKPIVLVFISSWAWIAGIFLTKDGPRRWGRRGLYVYLAAAVVPYFFSFLAMPSS